MRSGIINTLCVSPSNDNITNEVVSLHKSSIDFRKKNEDADHVWVYEKNMITMGL